MQDWTDDLFEQIILTHPRLTVAVAKMWEEGEPLLVLDLLVDYTPSANIRPI